MREVYPIYPWPRHAEFGDDALRLGHGVRLWCDPACPAAGQWLSRQLQAQGVDVEVAPSAQAATIAVGLVSDAALAERLAWGGEEVLPAEGYRLACSGSAATVAGADLAGCLYGASTLAQLARCGEAGPQIAAARVLDWPYKPLRGVHLYLPGRSEIGFFMDLLTWLASLRYNTLFLEVGGGMAYDRHPEVNEAWVRFCHDANTYPGGPAALQDSQTYPKDSIHNELGGAGFLSKAEVLDVIRHAQAHGMEVVPELQSLSHAYYLCCAHPEMAERQSDPWPDTYCPSNPKSYELYFDLLDEVIEVFQPRLVHIGHDEAYTFGVCDRCRGKSGAELLAGDLVKVHDYLSARGIRTALWGDKLMNIVAGGRPEGGRARRAQWSGRMDYTMPATYAAVDFVPKDMLILNWYWMLDAGSPAYFEHKGFQSIFGNFGDNFGPHIFRRWDVLAASDSVLGAEVSTWCDLTEYALGHNLALFNLLLSANMLWWPHYDDREREASLAAVARLQPRAIVAMGGQAPSLRAATRRPLPLSAAADAAQTVLRQAQGDWTGVLPVVFEIGEAAVTAGPRQPVSKAVPVGSTAASLVFLHYCQADRSYVPTWYYVDPEARDDRNLIGTYAVTYADGSTAEADLRQGENIAVAGGRYGESVRTCPYWAVPAWEGRDEGHRPLTLWAYEWVNPQPDKEIASVRLCSLGATEDEQIVLLALTVVE
ncbi:MAG: glycoside hydrolase family 20 zincin-like fold domain-containing protein [Candidatus Latescibacterota bacterium]